MIRGAGRTVKSSIVVVQEDSRFAHVDAGPVERVERRRDGDGVAGGIHDGEVRRLLSLS